MSSAGRENGPVRGAALFIGEKWLLIDTGVLPMSNGTLSIDAGALSAVFKALP